MTELWLFKNKRVKYGESIELSNMLYMLAIC